MRCLLALFIAGLAALAPVEFDFSAVGAAEAVKLPWSTFSGAAVDAVALAPFVCSNGGSMVYARLVRDSVAYRYFYAPETQLVAFATFDKNDDPVEIGLGKVDPAKPDAIPPLVWAPYDPGRHAGGPCADLFPFGACVKTGV